MGRKLAIAALTAVLAVALGADFLASDKPIVLHLDGETYWFPNLIDYDELEHVRGDELRARMTRDDWAVWAPVRHSPIDVRTRGRLEVRRAPSSDHYLGTDDRGRDVLSRLIHGTRATLKMAAGAAVLALLLGVLLAFVAVRVRGAADTAVVGACDTVTAIPALIVVVAAQGLIGAPSVAVAIIIIALPRAADTARLARAAMRTALGQPYADAARALGLSETRIVWRHALPQAGPQLAVATAITASTAVLAEAALSFLGFGTPPPDASWGELFRQAHQNDLRWWLVLPAGAAVAIVAAALNRLGQGD